MLRSSLHLEMAPPFRLVPARVETTSDNRACDQISPEIGVTATPVIDRQAGPNGAIYLVAMTKDASGFYHQRLHALDVTTGSELFNGPAEIQATYPTATGGTTVFDPGAYKDRAGLLLLNGEIYTTWAAHCDYDPYTGWIIAYSSTTLSRTRVLNVAANSNNLGPAIWMAGGAPAVVSLGNIYLLTGNGIFETTLDASGFPSLQDYGNSGHCRPIAASMSAPCASKPGTPEPRRCRIVMPRAARPFLFSQLRYDLDLRDAVGWNQSRDLDCRPRRKGRLHIVILHRENSRHLGCQVSVKAGDFHDVIPTCAGILQNGTDSFEGAGVADLQIRFALANAGDDSREIYRVARHDGIGKAPLVFDLEKGWIRCHHYLGVLACSRQRQGRGRDREQSYG
jgi:hypothetical protein